MFKKTKLFGVSIPFFGSFEEINLRFYVKRKDGNKIKKGVVFINETVPFKLVALLANKLYKEHYISIPTKHAIEYGTIKKIKYQWKMNDYWNSIVIESEIQKNKIEHTSMEEFIFERYFGFTKIDKNTTQEYRIRHPKWQVNKILEANISCDFGNMYGAAFENLSASKPDSVIIAEGSNVAVDWKRDRF